MKKFKFKFASVLELRKAREELLLRALGSAQSAMKNELNRKENLLSELEKSLIRREKLSEVSVSITAYQFEQEYINGVRQRIRQSDQAILKANRSVEKSMRAYLLAKRQSKIMETLFDKAQTEYLKEIEKREQKELDDLNLMRFRLTEDAL